MKPSRVSYYRSHLFGVSELGFVPSRSLKKTNTWMQPQSSHFEKTENMSVMLTTYYLGQSNSSGLPKYFWRYGMWNYSAFLMNFSDSHSKSR
jgi:hypothetical protein